MVGEFQGRERHHSDEAFLVLPGCVGVGARESVAGVVDEEIDVGSAAVEFVNNRPWRRSDAEVTDHGINLHLPFGAEVLGDSL